MAFLWISERLEATRSNRIARRQIGLVKPSPGRKSHAMPDRWWVINWVRLFCCTTCCQCGEHLLLQGRPKVTHAWDNEVIPWVMNYCKSIKHAWQAFGKYFELYCLYVIRIMYALFNVQLMYGKHLPRAWLMWCKQLSPRGMTKVSHAMHDKRTVRRLGVAIWSGPRANTNQQSPAVLISIRRLPKSPTPSTNFWSDNVTYAQSKEV